MQRVMPGGGVAAMMQVLQTGRSRRGGSVSRAENARRGTGAGSSERSRKNRSNQRKLLGKGGSGSQLHDRKSCCGE